MRAMRALIALLLVACSPATDRPSIAECEAALAAITTKDGDQAWHFCTTGHPVDPAIIEACDTLRTCRATHLKIGDALL